MSLRVGDEVREMLAAGGAVVALESSLIAQGLPYPHNVETARACEAAVREAGAVPATTAVQDGMLVVGADGDLIERLADLERPVTKAGARDLGPLLATRGLAATTVSAAMRLAAMAGIRVMGTGGIGGVHRGAGASFDISSDIDELAATPVAVVCSGAKAMLDVPATFELLESRRVPVIGIGTDHVPVFYAAASSLPVAFRVDSAAAAAATMRAHFGLPGCGGMLFVQPPPPELRLDATEVESWTVEALEAADEAGVIGTALTPFVLAHVARASQGRALEANVGLIVNNARAAAAFAVALASTEASGA
ncbi:MAG TPA: pseudouridine-5'-phosphate glycosidase [Candidatus Limnocylindria bacterium]|nr:pseudouridine-5'-phosphate glycosidase [Candidatus Limnocylindria bacterium]